MAIGTTPLFTELRGTTGPINYRTRRNGKIEIGQKRHPSNPQSTEQLNVRNAYGRLSELWITAPWIDKTPYDIIAKTYNISAWNAFLMRHLPIMRLNPVAYWPFVEGIDNTVHDFTTNNNHGTIYGASWETSQKYNIPYSNFDGTDDYILLSNGIIDLSPDCSFRALINISTAYEAENPRIISIIDNDGDNLQFGYMDDVAEPTDNGFYARIFDNTNTTDEALIKNINNYLTWTKLSGVQKFYINSELKATTPGGILANATFSSLGGGYTTTSFLLNGAMKEAAIFDYSVTNEQINHLDDISRKFYEE